MCIGNKSKSLIEPIQGINEKQANNTFFKNDENNSKINRDCIAFATHKIRVALLKLNRISKTIQKSTLCRIITSTTQPAHLLMVLAVATISCSIYPEKNESRQQPSAALNLIYLGSVSAHFGTQLWMTFVSGLTLYFSLPRRIFGKVQRELFPRYFLVNAIFSFITLSIFLNRNNENLVVPQVRLQVQTLILCFAIELVVRLYLTPPMLRFMSRAAEFEENAGVGMEIGRHQPGVLSQNKEYVQVYRRFRKLHMVVAIGNIITLACSVVHIHYLSNKLTFT